MKTDSRRILSALTVLALLGLVAGCESEAVAPQDQLPPLTAQDTAYQTGLVAAAITRIGPRLMQATNPAKQVVDVTWAGEHGLTGTGHIDYRSGPDGAPAAGSEATWARLHTDAGEPIVCTVPGLGGQTRFDLDIMANLDQEVDQATILSGSGGTMTSGGYVVTFALAGLVVGSGGYPLGGGLTTTAGGHTAEVRFNGTNTVTMIVDGSATYAIDLDTGEVTTDARV